jgi:CHAT domain-containing protein
VGDIIPLDAEIEFTPPLTATGEIVAFTLKASDGVSVSVPVELTTTITLPTFEDNDLTPPESTNTFEANNTTTKETPIESIDSAQVTLSDIEDATGVKPAVIYVTFGESLTSNSNNTNETKSQAKQSQSKELLADNIENTTSDDTSDTTRSSINHSFTAVETTNTQEYQNYLNLPPSESGNLNLKVQDQDSDELELILVTPGQLPIRKRLTGVTRSDVIKIGHSFQAAVTSYRRPRDFFTPAQQLYQWFIQPLEINLQQENIENLVFIMDPGIRSLPLAALYDGEKYLVEKYSVGLMPSLSLSDTRYVDVKNLQVLAMGAQTFPDQNPLPSVPVELSLIEKIWGGEFFLNKDFTEENLKQARANTPYGILHLATHGEFLPGKINNSYIQFSDRRLSIDQFRQLGLNNPPVELMVLSACRTALGDQDAELGFAGLALQAGVKTAMGSLWYVSDEGTLALMSNFYQQLKTAPIKAEALRQAQLAMLKGDIRLENGQLITSTTRSSSISSENEYNQDFTHPYYWSGFTMIGSPW